MCNSTEVMYPIRLLRLYLPLSYPIQFLYYKMLSWLAIGSNSRLTVDFFFTSRSTCWHVHVFMSTQHLGGQIMMLETVFSIYLCLIQFSDGITYQNMISKAVNIETGSLPAAVQSMITSGPISTGSLIWVRNSFPKLVQMVLCKKEASNIFLIFALTWIFPSSFPTSVNQAMYLNKN